MPKPNCYECHWKEDLPGSAHVKCIHPLLPDDKTTNNQIATLMAVLLTARKVPFSLSGNNPIGVVGNERGINNGWFNFPYNYDPIWLLKCDGFRQK